MSVSADGPLIRFADEDGSISQLILRSRCTNAWTRPLYVYMMMVHMIGEAVYPESMTITLKQRHLDCDGNLFARRAHGRYICLRGFKLIGTTSSIKYTLTLATWIVGDFEF